MDGENIQAYDPATRTLIWSGEGGERGMGGADLELADVAGDPAPELVVAVRSTLSIWQRTAAGYARIQGTTLPNEVIDLTVGDVDGSGPTIFALYGASWGPKSVVALDPALATRWSFSLPAVTTPTALAIESLPGPRKNLLLSLRIGATYDGAGEVRAVDPRTGELVWSSPSLLGAVAKNSLELVDLEGDGRYQLLLGSTYAMLVTR